MTTINTLRICLTALVFWGVIICLLILWFSLGDFEMADWVRGR